MNVLRLGLVCLPLALGGCGSAAPALRQTSAPLPPSHPAGHSPIRTVFLIVMENHDWRDIKGNPSAPYINHTLLPMASHAERYYNPPGNHPSLPNYLWLEAGTNFGVTADLLPGEVQLGTHMHLTALLRAAGISWRAYEQGISGRDCPLVSMGEFAPRHDPSLYFSDVTGDAAYCRTHERPLTQLASDLSRNQVARYNFITPDLCHDMHDSCPPLENSVAQGDAWLRSTIPALLRSEAYRHRGAIFITWDEGEGDDGPIGMIVLSPLSRGHGYAGYAPYTHSSTLRTLEEIFGVRPFLGGAAHATDLSALFKVRL